MIVIAWEQFPQYAARCVAALVAALKEPVVVVATKPNAPVEGMERIAGCSVHWVTRDDKRSLQEIIGEMPRAIFTTGWTIRIFTRFSSEVRAAGGQAFAMVDNNYWPNFKELLKLVRFRLLYRHRYDGYLVPGESGLKLMRWYGVHPSMVAKGFYSADETLFTNGRALTERPKNIVFMGQFIPRKNVLRLCEAFLSVSQTTRAGWTLSLYGYGVLKDRLPKADGISVNGFVQPEKLADLYRSARVFVLPSLEEHWGLVVHEAALSGCVLLLSDCIGAAADFVSDKNGVLFDPLVTPSITHALEHSMQMTDAELLAAQEESLKLGAGISRATFVSGVRKLLGDDNGRS